MAARDVMFISVLIFALAIGVFVLHHTAGSIVSGMVGVGSINESNTTVTVLRDFETATNGFDYFVIGTFFASVIGLIVTGWFVGGKPIFMFFYFLVVVIAVITSMLLSNVWETTTTASVFGTRISFFPLTNHLMNNLPLYIAIVGVIGIIVMFAKPQEV